MQQAGLVRCSGSRLEWEQADPAMPDGEYKASTWLHLPVARKARLAAAANSPVKLSVNGKLLIDSAEREFMPAYHRVAESQAADVELPAGAHKLELTALKQGAGLQVYVLAIAGGQVAQPGSHYCFTDMLFLDREG